MGKGADQFIKVAEIIPIHVERYNRLIDRLLQKKDYSLYELKKGLVNRVDYYKAREQKIKAYTDCIATMIQKEKILQYHNSGFQLEVINEKIEVKSSKPEYDFNQLTFEEALEAYQLLKKSRMDKNEIQGVIQAITKVQQATDDVVAEVVETPNIEQIKHKEIEAMPYVSPINAVDPSNMFKESLKRIAAKRIQEIGGHLDKDEKKYIYHENSGNK